MVDEQVAGLVAQARRKVVKAEHEYQRSGAVTLLAARPRRAHRHGARRPSPNDFASTAQLAATLLAFTDRYNQTGRSTGSSPPPI